MKTLTKQLFLGLQRGFDQALLLGARLNVIHCYQPLYQSNQTGHRSCVDRWQAIQVHLPRTTYSLLDVGSQIGFFTLTAAQSGGFCLGLERVWQYQAVAEAQRRLHHRANVAFLNLEVNAETTQGLPSFDVSLCLSVFHHWVIDWGFAAADQIFSQIAAKTQAVAFETGQFDEIDQPWAKKMGFMGSDCKQWMIDYLRAKGFAKISHLGQFPTHLGPHPRHLLYAEK